MDKQYISLKDLAKHLNATETEAIRFAFRNQLALYCYVSPSRGGYRSVAIESAEILLDAQRPTAPALFDLNSEEQRLVNSMEVNENSEVQKHLSKLVDEIIWIRLSSEENEMIPLVKFNAKPEVALGDLLVSHDELRRRLVGRITYNFDSSPVVVVHCLDRGEDNVDPPTKAYTLNQEQWALIKAIHDLTWANQTYVSRPEILTRANIVIAEGGLHRQFMRLAPNNPARQFWTEFIIRELESRDKNQRYQIRR